MGEAKKKPGGTASLEQLRKEAAACSRCGLRAGCTQVVFGEGDPTPGGLLFVGEAPGRDEDESGQPFVGTAGKHLTKLITENLNLSRDQVFITNLVKCRPTQPGKRARKNRAPSRNEIDACGDWLARQIEMIRPKIIVALGRHAGRWLSGRAEKVSEMRGKWLKHKEIPLRVLYHPSRLLREDRRCSGCPCGSSPATRHTLDDLKAIRAELEMGKLI